jgi:leucyl aminopeptidase
MMIGYCEGMLLGNYRFIKHKKEIFKDTNALKIIYIDDEKITTGHISELNNLIDAVYMCRDLVNEPASVLNTLALASEFENIGQKCGIHVEVMGKKKIEALKMGGILAVNQGSIDPPVFAVMEYKPTSAFNSKPLVLVGKGVVFDTGGLNLKTGDSMSGMKCDMAGAATVACSMYAIALNRLPIHVIALMPVTDNRPGNNAIAPGDIISMFDGTTVEVLNTDAEGRLILADALSYAAKFDPMLCICIATLTGAANRAIGKFGIVAMEKDADNFLKVLSDCGERVYERLAIFPFWDEYGELIKSEIADLKNIGGAEAGMITAGKFLAHFTSYPFIHLDIAGPAFLDKNDSYHTAGGTAIGLRLTIEFCKSLINDHHI